MVVERTSKILRSFFKLNPQGQILSLADFLFFRTSNLGEQG